MLTFVDKRTKLNKIFNNDEVIFYTSLNDLSKKITKYNENDKQRIKIAKKGRNKYLKYINSSLVADYIIKKTFNIKYKKKFIWEK